MTKEEAIRESYGDYWDIVEEYVDGNGWVKTKKFQDQLPRQLFEFYVSRHTSDNNMMRPKAITGIEDNNGWKLIEDLDIEDDEYVLFLRMTEGGEIPIFTCPLGEDFEIGYFTHWKRVDISKAPIY